MVHSCGVRAAAGAFRGGSSLCSVTVTNGLPVQQISPPEANRDRPFHDSSRERVDALPITRNERWEHEFNMWVASGCQHARLR